MSGQPVSGAGAGGSGGGAHKSKYKNAGLDTQEMRRRREEEGIQLRKQKREQQLFKRRNVHTEDIIQVSLHNISLLLLSKTSILVSLATQSITQ